MAILPPARASPPLALRPAPEIPRRCVVGGLEMFMFLADIQVTSIEKKIDLQVSPVRYSRLSVRDRRDNPKDPRNRRKSALEFGRDRNSNVRVECIPA